MVTYSLPDQALLGWRVLVTNFSSKVPSENTEKIHFFANESKAFLAAFPGERAWYLEEWLETLLAAEDTDRNRLLEHWDGFSSEEKKSLFDGLTSLLTEKRKHREPFYDLSIYDCLTERFPGFTEDPKYAASLATVWTDKRFYDETYGSKAYFLVEKILNVAKTKSAFKPLLAKMNAAAKANGQKLPFQDEIDGVLSNDK